MWDSDDSESYDLNEDMDVQEQAPPPASSVTGLPLAQYYFGPLLSPVPATPAQWTAYTEHRRGTNAKYKNIFDRRKKSINNAVAAIEDELDLEDGTLQRCVSILGRMVEWDDVEPRNSDINVRIYSLAVPKYIDVHIKYHCRSRMNSIEWSYSLGYRIHHRISGSPTDYDDPSTNGPIPMWHARGGWQSICWGYYDDEDNYGRRWRRKEVAGMGLYEDGVLDIHETLFGPIETPPSDGSHAHALLKYRRKLVTTVRLLLAAIGIRYDVACTDEERDERPRDYTLEGLGDLWVARGIRSACGFQLTGDAEAAKRAKEERRREARGENNYDDDDDDDDDDEDDFSDEYGW